MDSYVAEFQAAGGSPEDVLAKGNRSKARKDGVQGGMAAFILARSVGGAGGSRLAQDCIRKVEVLEYPGIGDGGGVADRG